MNPAIISIFFTSNSLPRLKYILQKHVNKYDFCSIAHDSEIFILIYSPKIRFKNPA